MTLDEAFGIVLKKRRTLLGVSQEEFAFRCDLDRSFISLLERGETSPTLRTLSIVAESLGVKVSTLIHEAEGILDESKI